MKSQTLISLDVTLVAMHKPNAAVLDAWLTHNNNYNVELSKMHLSSVLGLSYEKACMRVIASGVKTKLFEILAETEKTVTLKRVGAIRAQKKKSKCPIHAQIIAVWHEYMIKQTGSGFSGGLAETSAVLPIYTQLKKHLLALGHMVDDDMILSAWSSMVNKLPELGSYWATTMRLSKVNQGFHEIIAKAGAMQRTGKATESGVDNAIQQRFDSSN